jgi:hypothetical protein
VRTKEHKKDRYYSVRLMYDSRRLSGVIAARPGVTGVLQTPNL